MQNILVTGANGLLATNIIKLLLEKGYFVTGLLRKAESYKGLNDQKLTLYEGEFHNTEILYKVLPKCHIIIHAAALTAQNLTSYIPYHEINVKATEKLIEAAIDLQIKKLIYVSTANVFGYGTKTKPGNEEQPQRQPFTKSYYVRSKTEAQNRLASYSKNIDIITVNPTFMLGAFDSKPSSGKIILMGYNKKLIFYPPGGKNFIHVEDAAYGVIKALETGQANESYLLAGENLTYFEFFKKLKTITNQKSLMIKIPSSILIILGFFGSILQKAKIPVALNLTNAKILITGNYYSSHKAVVHLGLKHRPIENAISEALEWFSNQNMINKTNKIIKQ